MIAFKQQKESIKMQLESKQKAFKKQKDCIYPIDKTFCSKYDDMRKIWRGL